MRILVVDDHEVVREGLRATLAAQPGMIVVDAVADGRTALERTALLRPDPLSSTYAFQTWGAIGCAPNSSGRCLTCRS